MSEIKQTKSTHKIQWLNLPGYKGESWNPVAGCTKISEGCDNCYAEKMAVRLAGMAIKHVKPMSVGKYVKVIKGRQWDGTTYLNEEELLIPLIKWRRYQRVVFVCSMGDLFHESVPFRWIDKVMAVLALQREHIFIILTKRAQRMAEYFGQGKENLVARWAEASYDLGIADNNDDTDSPACFIKNRCMNEKKEYGWGWPLYNVWVGVTAENQKRANERVPHLLQVDAAVRFVSVEPMLGPVDLMRIPAKYWGKEFESSEFNDIELSALIGGSNTQKPWHLNWVICGGESGHNGRPVHPDWVRGLRDQCTGAGVPFFFKQWGEWMPVSTYDGKQVLPFGKYDTETRFGFKKVGKKASGNVLDGNEWEEYPGGEVSSEQ